MNQQPKNNEEYCRSEIERMLKNSQTKIIAPVITFGILREYVSTKKKDFSDSEIKKSYDAALKTLVNYLGHDFHIGAKYYDAYGSRMSRYRVLLPTDHLHYRLQSPFTEFASSLCEWIPIRIQKHIEDRLGIVPSLFCETRRAEISANKDDFLKLIVNQIARTPTNFEIFSFAVLKVHLEKFACKIYRDTRTAAHDGGVDISTNFGVVYQIKKLKLYTEAEGKKLYAELRANFDRERLQDGNVIVVIDDVSKDVRKYLVNLRIQSITKDELLALAGNLLHSEDRQKVLQFVFEEFRIEYSGNRGAILKPVIV